VRKTAGQDRYQESDCDDKFVHVRSVSDWKESQWPNELDSTYARLNRRLGEPSF
jgi:hypothetical protein